MKILFHEKFYESDYADNGASVPGRLEDIIGVCAGFDSYQKDVGRTLSTFDFYVIGVLMKKFAKRASSHRRFAILEGGYYLPDLGKNVLAFCQGFE